MELVIVMPLDEHVSDVFCCLELIAYRNTDTVVAILVIASIGGLVLSVEGSQHFDGLYTQVRHTVLKHEDVDTLWSFAIQVDSVNPFNVVDFPFDKLGIVRQFPVVHAIASQGIEHAIDIAEIILNYGGTCPRREGSFGIAYFPTEHVPMLFHLVIAHGA